MSPSPASRRAAHVLLGPIGVSLAGFLLLRPSAHLSPELIVVPSYIRVVAASTIPYTALLVADGDTTVPADVSWHTAGGGRFQAGVFTAPPDPGTYKVTAERGVTESATGEVVVVGAEEPPVDGLRLTGLKRSLQPIRDQLPVVLVSGFDEATGTCIKHLVRRTDLTLPNIGSSQCDPGLVALAPGRKPREVVGASFTEGADVIDLPLDEDPITVPVVIWALVEEGVRAGVLQSIAEIVNSDLDVANYTFAAARVGARFRRSGPIHKVWNIPAGMAAIGDDCASGLPKSQWHTPGALNVYYVALVNSAYLLYGHHCAADSVPDAIFIAANYAPMVSLAHEMGHALGLQHTGIYQTPSYPSPGDDATRSQLAKGNLMWSDLLAAGTEMSLGQAYRAVASEVSALQRLHLSPLLGRRCECDTCVTQNWPQFVAQNWQQFVAESDAEGRACPRITRTAH